MEEMGSSLKEEPLAQIPDLVTSSMDFSTIYIERKQRLDHIFGLIVEKLSECQIVLTEIAESLSKADSDKTFQQLRELRENLSKLNEQQFRGMKSILKSLIDEKGLKLMLDVAQLDILDPLLLFMEKLKSSSVN